MKNLTPPVSDPDAVSQEADGGQRSTGEGAESAMTILRDRRDVDLLVARAEFDPDCPESPGARKRDKPPSPQKANERSGAESEFWMQVPHRPS